MSKKTDRQTQEVFLKRIKGVLGISNEKFAKYSHRQRLHLLQLAKQVLREADKEKLDRTATLE